MNIYKSLYITIIFVILYSVAFGQNQKSTSTAYKVGERLTYAVSYKVSFVETDVGEIVFSVTSGMVNKTPAYHFNAVAYTYPFYNWFFEMKDVYDTWVDKTTFRPLYFKNNIKEGSYRFTSEIDYNWDKGTAYSTYRNLKRDYYDHKTLKLSPTSRDGISLFYELRSLDLDNMKSGHTGEVELVLCDTVRRVKYRFIGREIKDIPSIGKCRTLKFAGQLATSTDDSFKDGSEFFVWYSDDKNLIPLYVETPIRVGAVKVRLIKWDNLKYDISCRVK